MYLCKPVKLKFKETISRLASCSLRHGVPIEYLVDQLEKISGEILNNLFLSYVVLL